MAAPGKKSFCVLEYHTVSLWLLCNVHFVQSIRPNIATWLRWPKGTDHCSSEEYRCTHVDVCVARTWISYRCVLCHRWCTHRTFLVKKCFHFSCGCEQFHSGMSFGFLVANVCNYGEHYEMPCINWFAMYFAPFSLILYWVVPQWSTKSYVFYFAVQKCKDQDTHNWHFGFFCMGVKLGLRTEGGT